MQVIERRKRARPHQPPCIKVIERHFLGTRSWIAQIQLQRQRRLVGPQGVVIQDLQRPLAPLSSPWARPKSPAAMASRAI